jgi:hypothetical protein
VIGIELAFLGPTSAGQCGEPTAAPAAASQQHEPSLLRNERTTLSAKRTLLTLATLSSVAFLVLDLLQPWKSIHLYVPFRDETYFTVENRPGAWCLRIGAVGGLDGFEMALTDTNRHVQKLRSKHFPFPINWRSDWRLHIQARSPCTLFSVPAYFPALAFAIWPVGRIIWRQRRRWQAPSPLM